MGGLLLLDYFVFSLLQGVVFENVCVCLSVLSLYLRE